MIHLLHVTEDHTARNTGITSALDALLRQLHGSPVVGKIVSVGAESVPIPPGVECVLLGKPGMGKIWQMPFGKTETLYRLIRQADVVHLHGVWMWVQWAAARMADQQNIPQVLSVHGMFESWLWEKQGNTKGLKKKLYWRYVGYPSLRHVTVVHALTAYEAGYLRNYFPGGRIEVIPNSLDLEAIDRELRQVGAISTSEQPYFLYLGRIHPKKGIHLLIKAFAALAMLDFKLKIVGPVQPQAQEYAEALQKQVKEYGIGDRVEFMGAVSGLEKWRMYKQAWAYCLPSFSEGLAMVNIEAAACATPVLTTPESGVVAGWAEEGGVFFPPEIEAITSALSHAATWTKSERDDRGIGLRALVERTYDSKVTAPAWAALYQELAGR